MKRIKSFLRDAFTRLETGLDHVFGPAWNPLVHTGALGFFFYFIVAVSGVYIYVFFDTGTVTAFTSVERMSTAQWYHAGIMRSLHRYASDGLMLFMMIHVLREFAMDRFRGPRWFTWFTGTPIMWLVFICGITGYWLVWDKLAQYVAIATTEWLDALPFFAEPIARNFLSPTSLDDRFFTLLLFLHIAVPLILLFVLWIHLQRVSRPKIVPPRGLAAGMFAMLVVLSLVKPALSQGQADLGLVPGTIGLDWFYLVLYPLLDSLPKLDVWALVGVLSLVLAAVPWMPPMKRAPIAKVFLDHCNGCARCAADCPFNAIIMGPRTDGLPFTHQAVVDSDLCVSCGICMGACPSSTPFRRPEELVTGIDLPHFPLSELRARVEAASRGLPGPTRVIVLGCDHAADVAALRSANVAAVGLPCIAMAPPSLIDYCLSRDLFDGVFLTGCREEECYHRLGVAWMEQRIAGTRDPYLRARVPRERLGKLWAAATDHRKLGKAVAEFSARIAALPPAAAPGAASAQEAHHV